MLPEQENEPKIIELNMLPEGQPKVIELEPVPRSRSIKHSKRHKQRRNGSDSISPRTQIVSDVNENSSVDDVRAWLQRYDTEVCNTFVGVNGKMFFQYSRADLIEIVGKVHGIAIWNALHPVEGILVNFIACYSDL